MPEAVHSRLRLNCAGGFASVFAVDQDADRWRLGERTIIKQSRSPQDRSVRVAVMRLAVTSGA